MPAEDSNTPPMSHGAASSRPAGGWEPPSPEHLQRLLPQYEIHSMLGHGGMGAVYKGRQVLLDRVVAIKILPPEAVDGNEDANFAERFQNEARAMAKMNHPGIVGVYEFGATAEGQLYFVMEFVDGTDVAQMIQSQGRLPAEHALAITAHVCDALQYAHSRGVIHRDIKPANVLVNREGQVKVADFGLAKAADPGQTGITKTNMAMGTPDFIAPEALITGLLVDHRADLYAVGVMLHNMLTGKVPRGAFKPASQIVGCDARFDAIVTKAMQTEREDRYQSALEIRRDLDVILTVPVAKEKTATQQPVRQKPVMRKPTGGAGGSDAARHAPSPSAPRSHQPAAKPKAPLLIGIAAAVVIIGGGLFFMMSGKKPADAQAQDSSATRHGSDVNASGTANTPNRPAEVSATSTTKALAPALTAVPGGGWIDWLAAQKQAGTLPETFVPDGEGFRITGASSPRVAAAVVAFIGPEMRDGAVRVTFQRADAAQPVHALLRTLPAVSSDSPYAATYRVQNDRGNCQLTHRVYDGPAGPAFPAKSSAAAGDTTREHVLEFRMVGDRMEAIFDGETQVTASHSALQRGLPGVLIGNGVWIRKIEVLNLDAAPATAPLATAKQTIDLLALTDPAQDRLTLPALMGNNEWVREGTALLYKTDGKAGKIIAPVRIAASHGEIEVSYRRTSGAGRLHVDIPLDGGHILPLYLDAPGKQIINNKNGPAWPASTPADSRITIRFQRGTGGVTDRVEVQPDGAAPMVWTGDVSKYKHVGSPEPHPAFPGEPVTSLFVFADSYEIRGWTLRVFEGEAKVLRGGDAPSSPSGALTFGGHRYQAVPETGSWAAAKAKAEAMGGHLAVITSKEENDWIRSTFIDKLEDGKMLWIGATNSGPDGKWKWVTGEGIAFKDWVPEALLDQTDIGVGFVRNMTNAKVANATGWGLWRSKEIPSGTMTASRNRGFIIEWNDGASASAPAALVASLATRTLFEGDTFDGWAGPEGRDPAATWRITNGEVMATAQRTALTTKEEFTDFVLEFEWRVGPGGVGDVFYHVGGPDFESRRRVHRLHLCDPAAKQGTSDANRTGANYSIVLQSRDASRPVGQWNTARLVVRGSRRENWINGEKVCAYDTSDVDLRRRAGPDYGRLTSGAIALSAYTGEVAFRNLRLSASEQPSVAVLPAVDPSSTGVATKEVPLVNSLGMKFVPVPIAGGPTAGQRVLFSVWLTRVQDYAAFAKAQEAAGKTVDDSWKTQEREGVPAGREPDHPVVGVNWEDAQAFCLWLTEKDRAKGRLPEGWKYRLPSDEEWSWAVGLPAESGATPAEKSGKNNVEFPWGRGYPPKQRAGNYADESYHARFPKTPQDKTRDQPWIKGYEDGYATTAPVGTFTANAFGLYDMGGNVWQWCEDWFDQEKKGRVVRGASWYNLERNLLSSLRRQYPPETRFMDYGFRCVVAPVSAAPAESPAASVAPAPSASTPAGLARVRDLFNGRDATGWTGPGGAPAAGTWTIQGGVISSAQRTTLWSEESFGDFEFEIEWKVGPKGNGGVFYHVPGANELEAGEMQLADPVNAGASTSGALYGVLRAKRDASKPVGEWNTAKLVARGPQREHWINGELVCSYDVASAEFRGRLAASSIRTKPTFAADQGRFVLQANASEVFYRNARVRVSGSSGTSAAGPSDPRLAQLEAAFKTKYAAKAQQSYDASVAALNTSYIGALGRARTAAQGKGVLAEVTAMDDEMKRIGNNEGVPATDDASAPAALTTLRKTYRDTIAKHTAARDAAAAPVYDAYLKALDAYIAELTRADKLEDAKRVKALRDGVAAQKAAP